MKFWFKTIIIIYHIIFFSNTFGQDLHFSQFYASPIILNPANTGNYNGDWRIINNYRNQWRSITVNPYNTLAIGGDFQYYIKNQHLSAGLIFINDKAGSIGLNSNKFLFSAAYHKIIKNNSFHFGLQAGVVMKSFNTNDITLPINYLNDIGAYKSGYYPVGFTGVPFNLGERIYYPTINFGALWNRRIRNYMPEFGISLNNINMPKESFDSNNKQRLNIRHTYHAACHIYLNTNITITPRFMYTRESQVMEQVYGSNISYKMPANKIQVKSIFAGGYLRDSFSQQADAAIIVIGATIYKVDVGINYDINMSKLSTASNFRGAFEISIIYTEISTVFKKFTIPCERF